MTQIVTGKLDKRTFMMSDCIAHGTSKTFVGKIIKLSSADNVYFSLTGTNFITMCVYEYDYWLSINGEVNDFINGEVSINKLIEVAKIMYRQEIAVHNNIINFRQHRLFFINKEKAVFYDLFFKVNSNNEIENIRYEKNELKNNYYIDSIVTYPEEEISGLTDNSKESIREFCHSKIKVIIKNTDLDFDDFKNRFSFVIIEDDGKVTEERPHKYFSDVLANHYGIDYEKIDDEDFKNDNNVC